MGVILVLTNISVFAQHNNNTEENTLQSINPSITQQSSTQNSDSLLSVRKQAVKDSIKAIGDSLAFVWIKSPDPTRPNVFVDSLIELYRVKKLDFSGWAKKFPQKKALRNNAGKLRLHGEPWVLPLILFLMLFFAVLKNNFSKELTAIMQSFYSNRMLSYINKEDSFFNSWPFICLYVLFGFVTGIFFYLSGNYFKLQYTIKGFELFLVLSIIIIALFTLKIIALRLLGFFFKIQKIIKEYVSILYLSYFTASIALFPIIIAISLTPPMYAGTYRFVGIILLIVIFIFQFLRTVITILSSFTFPKMYLFIYFCALEICPLLILIKVLRL